MGNLIANKGRRTYFLAADVSTKGHSRHGAMTQVIGARQDGPLNEEKQKGGVVVRQLAI